MDIWQSSKWTVGTVHNSHSENHLCRKRFYSGIAGCVSVTLLWERCHGCFPGNFPKFFGISYFSKICATALAFTRNYVSAFLA